MKKLLISLLALLLVCSTLFLSACGKTEDPPTTDPVDPNNPSDGNDGNDGNNGNNGNGGNGGNGGGDVIDVYDPSMPMADFSAQVSSYLYPTGGLLAQPETNVFVGSARMRNDIISNFADVDEIIARGRPEHPLYGIYTYTHEHLANQDTVVRAGFTAARISSDGNGWTDEHQIALAESGMKIMTGMGCGIFGTGTKNYYLPVRLGLEQNNAKDDANMRIIDNYDLAGWINEYIRVAKEKIDKFGPEGTWWKEHPEVNYNPIIYYEFFNEPNYQYLIPVKTSGGADDAYATIKYQVYAIMQNCVYTVLHREYGDTIKLVGISAGGGAGEQGKSFVPTIMGYKKDKTVNELYNRMLDPNGIIKHASETDEQFAARQESVRQLRAAMGLPEVATANDVKIDMVATMDVMSIHPYMDGASPFSAFSSNQLSQGLVINAMRQSMIDSAETEEEIARAKNMPIWFTECGWQLKGPEAYAAAYPEDIANGINGGLAAEYNNASTGTSQILQAAMEVQDYLWGIRNGIDFISYMHMYDTDGCNYGLVNYGYNNLGGGIYIYGRNNGSPRLTMYAIETMTTLLPNPKLTRVIFEGDADTTNTDTEDYLFIYEIESDIGGEMIITVISPLKATPAQIAWDDDYALITDMFGKSQIVKATGGYINMVAGPYMQYISHVTDKMLIENGLMADVVAEAIELLSLAWNAKEDNI